MIVIFISTVCLFVQPYEYESDRNQIDIDLFKILVQNSESKGLWDDREMEVIVHVDPRTFIGNPSGPEEIEFEEANPETLELSKKIIEEFSVISTDILKDKICQSTRGLQPPSELGEKVINLDIDPHCESLGDFVSIAFGKPERCSSDCLNDLGIEKKETNGEFFTIRAIEISGYTLGVFNILVMLTSEGVWEYVDKKTLLLVMS